MNFRKSMLALLSVGLIFTAGCGAPKGEPTADSGGGLPPIVSSSAQSKDPEPVSGQPTDSEASGSKNMSSAAKTDSGIEQSGGEWIAYAANQDSYKLHVRRKDGTEDKIIVEDSVSAPCVAGEWVYYLAGLDDIYKVKLDGSQKTRACGTDALLVYDANGKELHGLNGSTSVTAEYRDGSVLYTCVQLHEAGDQPNTPSCYKLDPRTDKITEVKGK